MLVFLKTDRSFTSCADVNEFLKTAKIIDRVEEGNRKINYSAHPSNTIQIAGKFYVWLLPAYCDCYLEHTSEGLLVCKDEAGLYDWRQYFPCAFRKFDVFDVITVYKIFVNN